MSCKSPINFINLFPQHWHSKLTEVEATSSSQLKSRLDLLTSNETELNSLVSSDAEAFVDMKHTMEEDATRLNDQRQMLQSLQQLNEVGR